MNNNIDGERLSYEEKFGVPFDVESDCSYCGPLAEGVDKYDHMVRVHGWGKEDN